MSRRSSGAIVSYAYSFTQVAVNLLYVPLLLGAIGQAEYGLYQMIGSVISYLNVINTTLSAGATRYYCRYAAVDDKDGMANVLGILKRIYRVASVVILVAASVLAIVFRFAYVGSLSAWELNEGCILLAILAVNLLLTMNNTLSIAVITAHERFAFLKGTQLAVLVIQPIVVLALVRFGPYAWVVCLVQLVLNAICRTLQHQYAKKRLGMDDALREYDEQLEHDLIRFSGGIVLAAVADQVFWKTDQLILGWMYGTNVVAVYAVGAQLINSYMPLGITVSSVFLPKASEIWHRDHDMNGLSELFIRVGRLSLYPMMLVLTGFVVFGQEFIALWAGEGFGEAYWVALIALVPYTIDICQNIGLTILQVRDMYGFRARAFIIAALLNIALTFVLARLWGCIGAAASSAIALFVCSGLIMNWYYWKKVGLDVPGFWKNVVLQVLPILALCAVTGLIWNALPGPASWLRILVGTVVYAAAFCMVAWFLCATDYEKGFILRFTSRFKRSTRS